MCNYMRFGGCRVDVSAAWLDATRKVVAGLPEFVDEFEALLSTNEILMARCQGVGILRPELAVNAGVSGPMLRAVGVELRHSQSRSLRHLRPLPVPHPARRSRRHLRPLHDSRA